MIRSYSESADTSGVILSKITIPFLSRVVLKWQGENDPKKFPDLTQWKVRFHTSFRHMEEVFAGDAILFKNGLGNTTNPKHKGERPSNGRRECPITTTKAEVKRRKTGVIIISNFFFVT